jgi:hypothetical protein
MESFENKIEEIFDFDISEEVQKYDVVIEEGKILNSLIETLKSKLKDIDIEALWEKHQDEILAAANKVLKRLINPEEVEAQVEDVERDDDTISESVVGLGAALIALAGYGIVGILGAVMAIYFKTELARGAVGAANITSDIGGKIIKKLKDKFGEDPKMKKLREASEKRRAEEKARRDMMKKKSVTKGGMPKPPPSQF